MLCSYEDTVALTEWMRTTGAEQERFRNFMYWLRKRWSNVYVKDGRDVIRYLYNTVSGDSDVKRFMPIGWCGGYGEINSERDAYEKIVKSLRRSVVAHGRRVELLSVITEYLIVLHESERHDEDVDMAYVQLGLSVLAREWAFGIWGEVQALWALRADSGVGVVVMRAPITLERLDVDAVVVGVDGVERFVSIKSGRAFCESSLARYRRKSRKPDVYVSLVDGQLRYASGSMNKDQFVRVLNGGK